MIKEAYVSFEVAKLLKEKGFDEPCFAYYNVYYDPHGKDLKLWKKFPHRIQPNDDYLNVPTHQMAMAWLREIYDIYIVFFHTNKSGWWYNITDMRDSYVLYSFEKTMCSYEEIVDAALKYSLENVI